MQHYDVRLKAILQRAMPRLFRLLGLPGEVEEYLTVEFPTPQKVIADGVVRFPDGGIVQVEWQARNDPEMLWRCLDYYKAMARLWPKAPRILQFVVYLGDAPAKMVSEVERDRLKFGFEILCMHEVEAREFLESESDDERILAVLCASEDPRATIRAILGSWKHLSPKELSEKISDLQMLSQLRNRDTMVMEESLEMPLEIDITQNAMYKRVEARALAQGLTKGVEQGIEQGIAQGEAKLLTKLLVHKFGPLPMEIRARIAEAETEQLERWTDRSFDHPTLVDIFAD